MNTCPICTSEFKPARKKQVFCSLVCRQKNNALGRRGQTTGRQSKTYVQRLSKDGHLRMYAAKHPFADGRKEMNVHDMVMEMHLRRRLLPGEVVHHKDGVKTNNDPANLELMTHSQHSSEHMKEIVKTKPRKGGRFA
jgi:HNH endonuclease